MTEIINLDDIAEAPKLRIVVDGETHEMVEPTVNTFIENMKDIEGLKVGGSVSDELEVAIRIILRSFPTLKAEELRKWRMSRIEQLSMIARGESGQVVTKDKEAAAKAKNSGNRRQRTKN